MTRRLRLMCAVLVLWAGAVALLVAATAFSAADSEQDILGLNTTLTIPAVNCAGTNRLCLVAATWRDNGETVSGVQCNGGAVTLTRVTNFPKAAIASGVGIDLFFTHTSFNATCVITWTGGTPFRIYGTSAVFTDVDQTTPITDDDAQDNNAGLTGTSDLTLTTTAGDMVFDILHARVDEDAVPDGSQTQRTEERGTALDVHATSTLAASGASTTVGWTWTTGANFRHAAVTIKAAAGAASNVPANCLVLGVCE